MDLAMGAMGSLLCKLGEVIKKEYKLQKGVQKKVKSFSTQLKIMRAALRKVAEVPWVQLDENVKLWATNIRELSYDMEDVVDSLLVRVEGCEPDANQARFKKLMAEMANLFKKGKARREISTAVKEIHARLQNAAKLYKMYDIANLPAVTRTGTTDDRFMEVLHGGNNKNIIGLEKARDHIIKKISEGDHVCNQQLKILSIVGFGGLGKTTLAKEVYDSLKANFHCKAFVSVSRNPDMKKVLRHLLFELGNKIDTQNLEEEMLISLIQQLLRKERYASPTQRSMSFILLQMPSTQVAHIYTSNTYYIMACVPLWYI